MRYVSLPPIWLHVVSTALLSHLITSRLTAVSEHCNLAARVSAYDFPTCRAPAEREALRAYNNSLSTCAQARTHHTVKTITIFQSLLGSNDQELMIQQYKSQQGCDCTSFGCVAVEGTFGLRPPGSDFGIARGLYEAFTY